MSKHSRAVYNAATCQIAVVNKHHGKSGEYIGRGSPLGNPFVIGKHGTREEVIAKYAIWLKEQINAQNPTVLEELNRLGNKAIDEKGLSLQCFCHPKPCHGEVIKERLIKAIYTYFKDNK